ncbi:hypothetical protein J6590_011518 [Homalodisca vitripennis]|nr:hypothetical protein J6590_011518 [Homalodisca vitripennis]
MVSYRTVLHFHRFRWPGTIDNEPGAIITTSNSGCSPLRAIYPERLQKGGYYGQLSLGSARSLFLCTNCYSTPGIAPLSSSVRIVLVVKTFVIDEKSQRCDVLSLPFAPRPTTHLQFIFRKQHFSVEQELTGPLRIITQVFYERDSRALSRDRRGGRRQPVSDSGCPGFCWLAGQYRTGHMSL